MNGIGVRMLPRYEIRQVNVGRWVIDLHWPHGAIEQLIGVFVTHDHAKRWLDTGFSPLVVSLLNRHG